VYGGARVIKPAYSGKHRLRVTFGVVADADFRYRVQSQDKTENRNQREREQRQHKRYSRFSMKIKLP
jgi:hypothetical protein